MTIADLRTERPGGTPIGARFPYRFSRGWEINGRKDRWIVYAIIDGYNGGGGYWITEEWTWESNGKTCRSEIRSLTVKESRALDAVYEEHQKETAAP